MIIPIELAQAIADNARKKGLRTDKTTHDDECSQLHSELCEMYDAWRSGAQSDVIPGFTAHEEECADLCMCAVGFLRSITSDAPPPYNEYVSTVHTLRRIVSVGIETQVGALQVVAHNICRLLSATEHYAAYHKLRLLEAIRAKHAYNLTRPHGHVGNGVRLNDVEVQLLNAAMLCGAALAQGGPMPIEGRDSARDALERGYHMLASKVRS